MSYIDIQNVSRIYQKKKQAFRALDQVNLKIDRGEFLCLLGPSGCGKSTLLNILAGFDKVSEGSITSDGTPVTKPSVKHVTIFQNYGLLPWRTVEKNVELGLESLSVPAEKRQEIANRYLDLVGLKDFAQNHPAERGHRPRVSGRSRNHLHGRTVCRP